MWCWYLGVAARAEPDTELGSAWRAWHSVEAPSEATASWPGEKKYIIKLHQKQTNKKKPQGRKHF